MRAGRASGEGIDLERVGRTLEALIERAGRQVTTLDRATGVVEPVSAELASASFGLLPVFLVAADTVWRDATGKGLGVELREDPQALLGRRAVGVGGGSFSAVMLSMMEAIEQVALPREIPTDQLLQQWQDTVERLTREATPAVPASAMRAAAAGASR